MIKCPNCGSLHTACLSTRAVDNRTKRRRNCLDCGHRFTTYEVYEEIMGPHSFSPGKPGPKRKTYEE